MTNPKLTTDDTCEKADERAESVQRIPIVVEAEDEGSNKESEEGEPPNANELTMDEVQSLEQQYYQLDKKVINDPNAALPAKALKNIRNIQPAVIYECCRVRGMYFQHYDTAIQALEDWCKRGKKKQTYEVHSEQKANPNPNPISDPPLPPGPGRVL